MSDDLTPGPVQVPVTVALRFYIVTRDDGRKNGYAGIHLWNGWEDARGGNGGTAQHGTQTLSVNGVNCVSRS